MNGFLYRHYDNIPYVLLENESGRFLFAGGFQGDDPCADMEQWSVEAFRQLKGVFGERIVSCQQHYSSMELYRTNHRI